MKVRLVMGSGDVVGEHEGSFAPRRCLQDLVLGPRVDRPNIAALSK